MLDRRLARREAEHENITPTAGKVCTGLFSHLRYVVTAMRYGGWMCPAMFEKAAARPHSLARSSSSRPLLLLCCRERVL